MINITKKDWNAHAHSSLYEAMYGFFASLVREPIFPKI